MARRISKNPPTTTRARSLALAGRLGLSGTHQMPDGKFHPGSSHQVMVRAIDRFNKKKT